MSQTLAPAESFAIVLRCITQAVVTQGLIGRIANVLVGLLVDRFRTAHLAFSRLAARIEAGTYKPRRFSHRRKPASRKPRRQTPIPQTFGWLMPLLPMPDGNIFRGQLENLLRDPEMIRLMEAAPASAARILRPVCWVLRLKLPKILARTAHATPQAEPPASMPAAARPARPRPVAASGALRLQPVPRKPGTRQNSA